MDKVIWKLPRDTSPIEMKGYVSNEDDNKKEITAGNEDEGEINRDITEYEK